MTTFTSAKEQETFNKLPFGGTDTSTSSGSRDRYPGKSTWMLPSCREGDGKQNWS